MDRVFASGASATPPSAPGSPSSGYATAGNPGTGTPATKPGPYWYHMVTEEIRKVITDAGLTPDHTNVAQLSQAVQSLAGNLAKMHGQCRLAKSGANLVLSPFNGNKLMINGVVQTIPAAGVSLAATGLTANNPYFIYAYMNGSTMTLEASATGHSTDATTGVEIKTGDATRTLVGQARTIAGPAWQDTSTQRFVLSWFNRRQVSGLSFFTADRSTTSASYVELNSEIRVEFLSWGDEGVVLSAQGGMGTSQTSPIGYVAIAVDSTSTAADASGRYQVVNTDVAFGITYNTPILSEGYHYATILALISGGATTSLRGSATTGQRTTLTVNVKG